MIFSQLFIKYGNAGTAAGNKHIEVAESKRVRKCVLLGGLR
jgi:hypothetical protein